MRRFLDFVEAPSAIACWTPLFLAWALLDLPLGPNTSIFFTPPAK